MRSILKTRVLIVAELSANHNNDFDLAVETIKQMKESGADAVKVQTYRPESLALDVDNEYFGPKKDGPWKGIRPWDLYKTAAMPYEWQGKLKQLTEDLGMIFFSSPFDIEAVEFLEQINNPIYKIASFEVNDIPLIRAAALTMKPIIISTGVAREEDIWLAVNTCFEAGNKDVTLLKCTSQYPANISDANLLTIPDLKNKFGVKVGVSDHTMGFIVPVVAVSLGACVVEKHFILDRKIGGPDSAFSMEPSEFKEMVEQVRLAELSLGEINYSVSDKDLKRRRSLFAVKDINQEEKFTLENVRSIRPGIGLEPKDLGKCIGKKAKRDIKKGEPLYLDMID